MRLVYAYHECKITKQPCRRGSCKECPEGKTDVDTNCKNFVSRGQLEEKR